jgi:Tfp pilus assembly protein PilF
MVAPKTGMDEETRSKLASLGYIAPSSVQPKASAQPPNVAAFVRFEEATRLLQLQQTSDALKILEPLVAADPQNSVFRAKLADASRQAGNLPRAIELYRDAAGQTPDDPEAWYNLAAAFQDAGEQVKAADAAREALRRNERHAEAHNVLAVALASSGKLAEAKEEIDRAVELDPPNARVLNNLGNVARSLNRLDEAEAAYRAAIDVAPRYADPLNGLGTLLVQRDRPRDALPLFDRAIALAPESYEARLNHAVALAVAGERDQAVRELEAFLRATTDRPSARPQREAASRLLQQLQTRR